MRRAGDDAALQGHADDIADLVLESITTAIVVENYATSDGHGHSDNGYLTHGKRSVVVLLCHEADRTLKTDDWQHALVVTYEQLLGRLITQLDHDRRYAVENEEQYAFISQMHRTFASNLPRHARESMRVGWSCGR